MDSSKEYLMDEVSDLRATQATSEAKLTKFSTGGNGNNDDLLSMILSILFAIF